MTLVPLCFTSGILQLPAYEKARTGAEGYRSYLSPGFPFSLAQVAHPYRLFDGAQYGNEIAYSNQTDI